MSTSYFNARTFLNKRFSNAIFDKTRNESELDASSYNKKRKKKLNPLQVSINGYVRKNDVSLT